MDDIKYNELYKRYKRLKIEYYLNCLCIIKYSDNGLQWTLKI
jgi:hypothetical protein